MDSLRVAPFSTFRPAKFQLGYLKGYWVKLYQFFDGKTVHTFFHQSDRDDNAQLAHECGVYVTFLDCHVLLTPDTYPDLFKLLDDYVHQSDYNKES